MTLQQMEYVVAVDKYRHFAMAAESCGVAQSTLSSLIQKLETELDVVIFDRSSHPVRPTELGREIIAQAKVLLFNASQMEELVSSHKGDPVGKLRLGVASTIAPYVIPKMFKYLNEKHPDIDIYVEEGKVQSLIAKMERAELDLALLAGPLESDDLLEVPVYKERLVAYVSPKEEMYRQQVLDSLSLPLNKVWVLHEAYCPGKTALPFCRGKEKHPIYEAGSIETLVKIVDENGGYTIIPELHVPLLRSCQQRHIRHFAQPEPVREISFVIRRDFVRERLLNIMLDALKQIIPTQMLNGSVKKFPIKL